MNDIEKLKWKDDPADRWTSPLEIFFTDIFFMYTYCKCITDAIG